MKKALTYVVFFDVLFIFLLSVSALFGGIMGRIVYYFAFAVPIFLAIAVGRSSGLLCSVPKFRISSQGVFLTTAAAAPVFCVIFFISWLTSLALSRFGTPHAADVSGNIVSVILTHAVLTSVCEEMLFRYIPLAYLSHHSKRFAVVFSALFFALVHCNLFQIPYALMAGIIFAVLDIAFDSIIPSLLLHFGNNLISIIWLRGGGELNFVKLYVIILLSASLLSLIPVILLRKRYKSVISSAFEKGDFRVSDIGYAPVIFIAMTIIIALASL